MTERARMLLEALERLVIDINQYMGSDLSGRELDVSIETATETIRAAKAFQEAQSGESGADIIARLEDDLRKQNVEVAALLHENTVLRDVASRATPPLDGGVTEEMYAQLKISNKPDYWKGVSNGVRAAVTWLHRRALEMNDPAARAILHKAGSDLGERKAHHSIAELEKLSHIEPALT